MTNLFQYYQKLTTHNCPENEGREVTYSLIVGGKCPYCKETHCERINCGCDCECEKELARKKGTNDNICIRCQRGVHKEPEGEE